MREGGEKGQTTIRKASTELYKQWRDVHVPCKERKRGAERRGATVEKVKAEKGGPREVFSIKLPKY